MFKWPWKVDEESGNAEMVTDEVRRVQLMQMVKVVEAAKQTYQAPAVVLATGAPPKKDMGSVAYSSCRSIV